MLLEFSVSNFRSFAERATLSLAASSDRTMADTNLLPTGLKSLPSTIAVAAIYGANASGKSNLVRAMQLMRGIVADSAGFQPDQTINVQPFMLDPGKQDQPIEFEMTFLADGVRYQYGFAITSARIVGEWLLVYRTAKAQRWFSRQIDLETGKDSYEFGSFLGGQRRLWQDATKPNSLYLSVAAQLNSEQLTPVFRWIVENLVVFENGGVPLPGYTIARIQSSGSTPVVSFLGEADIGIADIAIEEQAGFTHETVIDLATGKADGRRKETNVYLPKFEHRNDRSSARFDFGDESEGTRKLFSLFGPLADIFEHGRILIIDELDRSLHALLVRQIVRMFQDPSINTRGAQLIFTTHDTALLDADLLRRDQIWFAEKSGDQASNLFPLTDFAPRKNEAFEKGYLAGRYGAIPILRRLKV